MQYYGAFINLSVKYFYPNNFQKLATICPYLQNLCFSPFIWLTYPRIQSEDALLPLHAPAPTTTTTTTTTTAARSKCCVESEM